MILDKGFDFAEEERRACLFYLFYGPYGLYGLYLGR